MSEQIHIQAVMIGDDGTFPNNPNLPLIVYQGALLPFGKDRAAEIEARFGNESLPPASERDPEPNEG